MIKTSIRFFEDIPVRAVWESETSKWWLCAVDIAEALTKSSNPRSYWNTLKRRKNELSTICKQLKLKAKDGKSYLTGVVDENGVTMITALIPAKNKEIFSKWLKGMGSTVDEKSKQKAYELFENGLINEIEVGTKGLEANSRIHFRCSLRFCRTNTQLQYCQRRLCLCAGNVFKRKPCAY